MAKRAAKKKSASTNQEECFLIMPISDPDGYESGHFRRVRNDLFAGACELANYKDVRADDISETNVIHLDFLQRIIQSPMAICDLSTRNPNVLFELGVRQAFDKPVVIVQQEGTERIFDVSILRAIEYKPTLRYRDVLEKQKEIAAALIATRDRKANSVNSLVSLLSITPAVLKSEDADGGGTQSMLRTLISMVSRITDEQRSSQVAQQPAIINVNPQKYPAVVRVLNLIAQCIKANDCTDEKLLEITRQLSLCSPSELLPNSRALLKKSVASLSEKFPEAAKYLSDRFFL